MRQGRRSGDSPRFHLASLLLWGALHYPVSSGATAWPTCIRVRPAAQKGFSPNADWWSLNQGSSLC